MQLASPMLELPLELNFEGNEHRPLLGENLSSSVPWSEDHRWWVRLPARNLLALPTTVRKSLHALWKDYTLTLLIFLPLALLASSQNWGVKSVFALNFFALLALETRFISTAERLWLFSGSTAANILTEILPNIFPFLIGITGIIYDEIKLVESFIVGSLIADLLVGTGLSLLIGGLWHGEQRVNPAIVKDVSALTLLTAFPFVVSTSLSASFQPLPPDLDILAAAEAGILLIFYIMWLFFRYKTHVFLFHRQGELYSSPIVGDGLDSSTSDTDILGAENVQLPSHSLPLLWLIVIFAFAVQCSTNLIRNVPDLLQLTSLSRPFIGAVLLPVITSLSNCLKTCLIAKTNRMELVLHLTVETAVAMVLLNLPGLTFASMMLHHGAMFNINFFQNISAFISVLTTAFFIKDGVFHYMKGCMALALYLIIILALYMYPSNIMDI